MTNEAKIVGTKIEFGKCKDEIRAQKEAEEREEARRKAQMPDDYGETLSGAAALACQLVVPQDGQDPYDDAVVNERQRVLNGIMKMKGLLHTEPAASTEEIMEMMKSPHYQAWRRSVEWQQENPELAHERMHDERLHEDDYDLYDYDDPRRDHYYHSLLRADI